MADSFSIHKTAINVPARRLTPAIFRRARRNAISLKNHRI